MEYCIPLKVVRRPTTSSRGWSYCQAPSTTTVRANVVTGSRRSRRPATVTDTSASVPSSGFGAVPTRSGSDVSRVAGSHGAHVEGVRALPGGAVEVGEREGAQGADGACGHGAQGVVARRAGRRGRERVGRRSDLVHRVPHDDLPGATAEALPQVEVVAQLQRSDRSRAERGQVHRRPPGERRDEGPDDHGRDDERDRGDDRDGRTSALVGCCGGGGGAEGQQEQVAQGGPGEGPAARREPEDDGGDPERRQGEAGQCGCARGRWRARRPAGTPPVRR